MAQTPELSGNAWLLSTGQYSDFEVHCGSSVFKTHRAILASNCEYFRKMFENNMADNTRGFATFPDEEPHIVARLLQFVYTSDYSKNNLSKAAKQVIVQYLNLMDPATQSYGMWSADYDVFLLHTQMFAVADKYRITSLKTLSRERFLKQYCQQRSTNDVKNPAAGEKENLSRALIDLLRMIYRSTPSTEKGLRDIMMRSIQRNLELVQDHMLHWFRVSDLFAFMAEEPDFAQDLAIRRLGKEHWKCEKCGDTHPVVVTICENHGTRGCNDVNCQNETILRGYCVTCMAFGTLRRPATS